MIRKIIAIAGLPRSGTTLLTAILGAHSEVEACFEPWNQSPATAPTPEQTPEELLRHFKIPFSRATTTLVVKETSVDFQGLLWLQRFLAHNSAALAIETVWILRCYRHNYLSFMNTGREQWGNESLVVNTQTYGRWVARAQQATQAVSMVTTEYSGIIVAYERLATQPEATCQAICDALTVSYEPGMLEYHAKPDTNHVRGDVGLATQPQPVSSDSTELREEQWQAVHHELSQSDADTARERLDEAWHKAISSACVTSSRRSEVLSQIPAGSASHSELGARRDDVRRELRSRDDWQSLVAEYRRIVSPDKIAALAEKTRTQGFSWEGKWIKPSMITAAGNSNREGFVHNGINSRQRAVLSELAMDVEKKGLAPDQLHIYAPEYLGSFASYLRGEFSNFYGSEFLATQAQRIRHASVPHEDLTKLSFADGAMTHALVNDIFEHLPDIGQALCELSRILAPGGTLLSTFPFAFKRGHGSVRAKLRGDGSVEHIEEPEYHGDPVSGGALVFRVPGWDLLEECRDAGFAAASMVFLSRPSAGIISDNVAGIFVLKATKAPL